MPQPRQLLLERDRLGTAIGPGGLGADVDDVGTFLDQPVGMLQRDRRIEELATVGKGVRGNIEYPHNDGAFLGQEQAEDVRQAAGQATVRATDGPIPSGEFVPPIIVMASRFARGTGRCQAKVSR